MNVVAGDGGVLGGAIKASSGFKIHFCWSKLEQYGPENGACIMRHCNVVRFSLTPTMSGPYSQGRRHGRWPKVLLHPLQ
jgi:hypothetical protein